MTGPSKFVYWNRPWWLLSLRCPSANMSFRVRLNRHRVGIVRGQRAVILRWRRDLDTPSDATAS